MCVFVTAVQEIRGGRAQHQQPSGASGYVPDSDADCGADPDPAVPAGKVNGSRHGGGCGNISKAMAGDLIRQGGRRIHERRWTS